MTRRHSAPARPTGIDSIRADIAFIGVGGFAEDGGMTDYSAWPRRRAASMILAGRAYMLADHTKFTAVRRSVCPIWTNVPA